jgi:hypothetical protein
MARYRVTFTFKFTKQLLLDRLIIKVIFVRNIYYFRNHPSPKQVQHLFLKGISL